MRKRNTNKRGDAWTKTEIDQVWSKGHFINGQNPLIYRKDNCGAVLEYSKYGDAKNVYGWEIDHIKPVAKDGNDDLINLQPLQWENNRHKSDNWPKWECLRKQ